LDFLTDRFERFKRFAPRLTRQDTLAEVVEFIEWRRVTDLPEVEESGEVQEEVDFEMVAEETSSFVDTAARCEGALAVLKKDERTMG
jgi:hypothetical protein